MTKHTTITTILTDGTHRTTQFFRAASWRECVRAMSDVANYLTDGTQIASAVVSIGTDVQMYTANEVIEFVSKLA